MSIFRMILVIVCLCPVLAKATFIYDEQYKQIRPILYPGSLFGLYSEAPEFYDRSANWILIETLKAKYGDPFYMASEEYNNLISRVILLQDLQSVINEHHPAGPPAALSGLDLGLLVRQNWTKQMRILEKKPTHQVIDVYLNEKFLRWSWIQIMYMLENSRLPLKFGELNNKQGFMSWVHEYVKDRNQLQMFYRIAMNKPATPHDLGIFVVGFIDVTREIEGANFELAWKQWIRNEVRSAVKRHLKMPEWIWTEVYPGLLKDARLKEGVQSPYLYGFRETLHSYLEITRIEGLPLRLADMGSDAELRGSVQMVMTSLLNREIKSLPVWEKATNGVVEWLLPNSLEVADLKLRLNGLLGLDGRAFTEALNQIIDDVGTEGADAFALRGAMWNMNFQTELQRFLLKNAKREVLSVEKFFQLSNYVANQKALTRILVSYIESIQSIEDFHLASFKMFQRVGRDLGWVKFRHLDESPAFRIEAPILADALWVKYQDLQSYDVSKADWLRETWEGLLTRRQLRTRFHLDNFYAMMLRAEPSAFYGVLTQFLESSADSDWALAMSEHYGKQLGEEMEDLEERALERASECESLLLLPPPKS